MIRKFFPLDKNYLLEQAQLQARNTLLQNLVKLAGQAYEQVHNPLGLEDNFVKKIRSYHFEQLHHLDEFYNTLCGIYRFRFGNNQLEFLWDGMDHQTNYRQEWDRVFNQWITEFCKNQLFVQAVLDLTVFMDLHQKPAMAEARMQHFIKAHFALKLHKTRGIVAA